LDATLEPAVDRVRVRGLDLSVRQWQGGRPPSFLLVHGLASNARTWDGVASQINRLGHRVVAVDQRGHGLSSKPDSGYGFDEVSEDLRALIDVLDLGRPVLAGQSWGGNVVLHLAARRPQAIRGLVLVDGGFIDLASRPNGSWDQVAIDLRPPNLTGTPLSQMRERMKSFHPGWPDEAIEATLANFEHLPDGTVRPWLSLDRHMQILRALWEQRPADLYAQVTTPTLIAVADNHGRGPPGQRKEEEVSRAQAGMPGARLRWFHDTAHDIHVERPADLAAWLLSALDDGFFDRAD
jgi:pimeloyl-ACP methyl ester carboxylesterase